MVPLTERLYPVRSELIYAHDIDAGRKHDVAKAVLRELWVDPGQVIAGVTIQNPF